MESNVAEITEIQNTDNPPVDISLNIGQRELDGLSRFNILLGKNGCGKSTLLRAIEQHLRQNSRVRYITPERGGHLTYDAGTEQNTFNSLAWLSDQRRQNQATQFRQQSVSQFRRLETLVLRRIEKDRRADLSYSFEGYLKKLNSLLDNVELRREDEGVTFTIYNKVTGEKLNAGNLSSGESELVSLGIECLVFSEETANPNNNWLLMDEPDVHLHPDLQVRLIAFLKEEATEKKFNVIIATHSTAIVGALESHEESRVALMLPKQDKISFKPIDETYNKILPIFGAHPLSNVFNQKPIFLVEGEDDERIWQQAVRTSEGMLRLYPCGVESVTQLSEYENTAKNILNAVYENSKGYSLRDGDDRIGEDLSDELPIMRFRLNCYSAENLLLTDEVLDLLGTNWAVVQEGVKNWITVNPSHKNIEAMKQLAEDFDRQKRKLKDIRNDLMGIIGSNKPWEVAIGATLGKLKKGHVQKSFDEGKLCNYLTKKLVDEIFG